ARLCIEEKERLVMAVINVRYVHRAADIAAKLVPVQPGRLRIRLRYSVVSLRKNIVPVELEQGAVKAVCTGLDNHVHGRAGSRTRIRPTAARIHTELRNRVDRRR